MYDIESFELPEIVSWQVAADENSYSVSADFPEAVSLGTVTLDSTYKTGTSCGDDVYVKSGTVVDASYPAAIRITTGGKSVTLENSRLSCSSVRNAVILFGEDASGDKYYDGTVTFTGNQVTLDSRTANCIDAAGIIGNNLTVNFSGNAEKSGGIRFISTQGTGPANYASAIKAKGFLTINGTFGGTVQSILDCTGLQETRWAEVSGFSAGGDLLFNGDMAGTIALLAYTQDTTYDFLASRAYGLYSGKTLTVDGSVSGTILALAETNVYGIYGAEGVNVTITGTIFAGVSAQGDTTSLFLEKLADPDANQEFLAERSGADNVYAIYSPGKSDVVFASGALIWGNVFLQKESSLTISSAARINGDVTLYGGEGKCKIEFLLSDMGDLPVINGRLYDYLWGYSSFVIDAGGALNGQYILADDFALQNAVTISVEVDGTSHNFTVNSNKSSHTFSNGMTVEVDNTQSRLVVNVSGSNNVYTDTTLPILQGVPSAEVTQDSALIFWDAATDNVKVAGYCIRIGDSSQLTGEGSSVSSNSYSLTGLENGEYYFQVRAYDSSGNLSEWSQVQSFTVNYTPPVYLPYEIPRAEYMYGCSATAVGMMLGYYDRFGYAGYNVKNLISGTVELNARGLDGNKYDMDAFDTVLGSAIASQEYVARFYDQSASTEYGYTFLEGTTELDTTYWNCIADYLGTGQYWRGNGDLSTLHYLNVTLEEVLDFDFTKKISGGGISVDLPAQYQDLLYGLNLYVTDRGYALDTSATRCMKTSNNGGDFDFEDYKAEIDAGRCVIIGIEGHSMLGYGYDDTTQEIIFDDTYEHDQRMVWGGSYYYSGSNRKLQTVILVVFDTTGLEYGVGPDAPIVKADTEYWTRGAVTLSAAFDELATVNEYSFDNVTWLTYTHAFTVDSNKTVYFRSKNGAGYYSSVTSYTVSNIDLTAPVVNVSGHENWSSGNVTLTISSVDEGSGVDKLYYSKDNRNWLRCTGNELVVSENGTIWFKCSDEVGNTEITSLEINCIDRDAPSITVQGNPAEWSCGSATLTLLLSDKGSGVDRVFYSFDGRNWEEYENSGVTVDSNKVIYFKAHDQVDNQKIVSVEVTLLDNSAPSLVLTPDTLETARQVTVSCSATDAGSGIVNVEYSLDDLLWHEGQSVTLAVNGTVYFRSTDGAGNTSKVSYTVSNIDDVPPEKPAVFADITEPTKEDVTVTAEFSSDSVKKEYSTDNIHWQEYTCDISMSENGTLYFRGIDSVGNISEVTVIAVENIDKTPPSLPQVSADQEEWTCGTVTVRAEFSSDSVRKEYSTDNIFWQEYTCDISMSENGTLYFRGIDSVGNISDTAVYRVDNIDTIAPDVPQGVSSDVSDKEVVLSWRAGEDPGGSGIKGWSFRYGSAAEELQGEGEFLAGNQLILELAAGGRFSFQVRSEDFAGNVSAWSEICYFEVAVIKDLQSSGNTMSWNEVPGTQGYIVACAVENSENFFYFETDSAQVDFYFLASAACECQVKTFESDVVSKLTLAGEPDSRNARKVTAAENGFMDLFAARSAGVWGTGYLATHQGWCGSWEGTGETVVLKGKNRITDIFDGSSDTTLLILTDSENGDALFIDDIYSAMPERENSRSRLSQINEIRMGAGDDIVDMTSERFLYEGELLRISGGAGNDVIWANCGSSVLLGDGGSDRIVGGSGDDIIAGGSGNDSLHGGGGNDIFTFCTDWGNDEVVQLENGTVTLWFETGSAENWNSAAMTYTDGVNTVHVTGVSEVALKFGNCAELGEDGAFAPESSSRIFEEKSMLA